MPQLNRWAVATVSEITAGAEGVTAQVTHLAGDGEASRKGEQ